MIFKTEGRSRSFASIFDGIIVCCACLIILMPLIVFRYFPNQDGPAHVNSTFALAKLSNDSQFFSQYFHPLPFVLTNWVTNSLLSDLRHIVSPLHLEPAFIALYALFMMASIVVTTRHLLHVPLGYALLFFPLIYNHMLHMGSYNLAISYGFFLILIGVCHRYLIKPSIQLGILVCVTLILIFTTHVEMAIVSTMCVMIYAAYLLGSRFLGKNPPQTPGDNIRRIRNAAILIIACIPVMGLCVLFHLQNPNIISSPHYVGIVMKAVHLGFLSGIATYTVFGMAVSAAFFIMLLLATSHALAKLCGWPGRFDLRLGPADVTLLCFLCILALYAVIPDGLGDAFNIEERLMIPLLMTLLCWLALKLSPVLSTKIVAGLAASILALQTIDRVIGFYQINKPLEEFSEVSAHLPENSAIAYIDLDDAAKHQWRRQLDKPFAIITRFDPERHFMGEIVQDRNIAVVSNYEASIMRPYFRLKYQSWLSQLVASDDFDGIAAQEMFRKSFTRLIKGFKGSSVPVDYLAVWALYPSSAEDPSSKIFLSKVYQDYTLIFTSSQNHMFLYRLKNKD